MKSPPILLCLVCTFLGAFASYLIHSNTVLKSKFTENTYDIALLLKVLENTNNKTIIDNNINIISRKLAQNSLILNSTIYQFLNSGESAKLQNSGLISGAQRVSDYMVAKSIEPDPIIEIIVKGL